MNESVKTGTTTLGIVCSDGIIVAADKRATAGHMIVMKDAQKVIPLNDQMILTIAGSVSDAQLFIKYIKAETRLNELRLNRKNTAKEVANLIGSILYNAIRRGGSVTHFLFAAKNEHGGFELYDIFPDGSVALHSNFICSGSGSVFAIGVLETLYKPELTVAQGADVAKRALLAAITNDSASGNGADIYKLTESGVALVETIVLKTSL